MRSFNILAAAALVLTPGSAAIAKEKAQPPKEKKICRTVEFPGRITPQKVCRKVERPAAEEESQRETRDGNESVDRSE